MKLINKELVMKIIRKHNDWYGGYDERVHDITEKINALPTIEERKTGKWKTNSDFTDRLICSECSAQFDMWHWEAEQMNYCPHCGAKMEGAEE